MDLAQIGGYLAVLDTTGFVEREKGPALGAADIPMLTSEEQRQSFLSEDHRVNPRAQCDLPRPFR